MYNNLLRFDGTSANYLITLRISLRTTTSFQYIKSIHNKWLRVAWIYVQNFSILDFKW